MKKKHQKDFTFIALAKANLEVKKNVKQEEFIKSVSFNIMILFWKLGKILNDVLTDKSFPDETKILNNLSAVISPVFGTYFSKKNILLMHQFARKYSLATIRRIGAHVHWDYIHELINLGSEEELFFYIKLINEQSLSVGQLKSAISAQSFIKENEKYPAVISLAAIKVNKNLKFRLAEKYFGSKEGDEFYQLLQLDGTTRALAQSLVNDETILQLSNQMLQLITEFQSSLDYFLNTCYNNMFWDFGNQLLHIEETQQSPMEVKELDILANNLNGADNSFFDKEILLDCISFASQYRTHVSHLNISPGVSWEQIRVLLKVGDLARQKLYAEKILAERLTLENLNNLIAKDKSASSKAQKNQNQKHQVFKKNNVNVKVTWMAIEDKIIPVYNPSQSIFKNQVFCRLATTV